MNKKKPSITKIAFFNRPLIFEKDKDIFEIQEKFIHYGILSLASFLKEKQAEVKIFDYYQTASAKALVRVKKDLLSFSPDIVGLSAFTTDIYNAHQTAKFIKKILGNRVLIVIGGTHLTALPKETMRRFSSFDVGVIGEGELTMTELLKKKPLKNIRGIIYRNKKGVLVKNPPRKELVDINKLPLPKYELLDLKKYVQPTYQGLLKLKKNKLVLPLEATRGCPFNCSFCFRTVGRKTRFKNPELVVKEIERLVKEYKADQLEFIDGTFGISKNQLLKICQLLLKNQLNKKVKFLIRSRVDVLDEESLKNLKQAGCFYLSIGIEAASNYILRKSGKGITLQQIRKIVKLAAKIGIEVHGNFILGLPCETVKDIKEKVEFAKSLPIVGANFAILVPFPGTEIYNLAKKGKSGFKLATDDYRLFGKQGGKALINERLSQKKLEQLQKYCYRKFYLSSPKRCLVFLYHLNLKRLLGIFKRSLT